MKKLHEILRQKLKNNLRNFQLLLKMQSDAKHSPNLAFALVYTTKQAL